MTWRTPPEPGLHCDSVEGHQASGQGGLPTLTEDAEPGASEGGEAASRLPHGAMSISVPP